MTLLLQHLLTESAQRTPEAIAVLFENETLRYGELDRLSDSLAHALVAEGVRPGDRVAFLLPKSPASLIAIHGILKAGGVYVPLDSNAPAQRLAYILSNCGVRRLITTGARAETARRLVAEGAPLETVLFTDSADATGDERAGFRVVPWEHVATLAATGPPAVTTRADDLAYILYTSGSTGTPKGVMISHLNALTFVHWAAAEFGVAASDRLSSHAPLHFDLSIFDLYAAMKAGATMALVPDGTSTFPIRLGQWIERHRISVWYSVPSILTLLLLKGRLDALDLSRLRLVLFAGEVFPNKYLAGVMRAIPGAAFHNLYGPTETNVVTSYHVPSPPAEDGEPIPIGRACEGTEVSLVDDDGRPLEGPGATGELRARGTIVAHGYWGDPDRTARGFSQHTAPSGIPERAYRTGDMVTRGVDGNYRLIGRRDRMIKSRGYRIELDEIESVLLAHPAIREAAVVAVPDELIGNRLRAFVACAAGEPPGTGALRDWCLEKLPRYMVPESFDLLEDLPKTSTGKIDRPRLARG